MLFRIRHSLHYRYDRPVFFEPLTLRLTPRQDSSQRLLHHNLEVEQLDQLEQQVLHLRFREDNPLSLARAADCLGLTKEKVQRLERQAFHKLRRRVEPMLEPQRLTACSATR